MNRRDFATRLSLLTAGLLPNGVRGEVSDHNRERGQASDKHVYGEGKDKGQAGVYGVNFHGGDGVVGQTDSGRGVWGDSATGIGVYGRNNAGTGPGVYGESPWAGVQGVGTISKTSLGTDAGGTGVLGTSKLGIGVQGQGGQTGVEGICLGSGSTGVNGQGEKYGVSGVGKETGVSGSSEKIGVEGSGGKIGVLGSSSATNGLAGYFAGRVIIDRTLWLKHATSSFGPDESKGYVALFDGNVEIKYSLTKAGGSFKIDHPLAPARKYLSHSFVESPDMMNVYNGNVTTDANGDATVTLPAYFAALNRDYRYQLTVIGQFAQAIVASKIKDNRFTIKTDKPNVELSWQVIGIRQDAWANAHRIQVEEDKPAKELGSYLHAELFGQPTEKRLAFSSASTDFKS